ncbi:hypothetical protein BH20ACI3_BH20ACI3_41910 [soil metagenome]
MLSNAARLKVARAYVASGLSLIPIGTRSKSPTIQWKDYQERPPTVEEVTEWVDQYPGLGVVCGPISGNLEVLDLEADAPLKEFHKLVEQRVPGLSERLPRVRTPSGGRHLFYLCQLIEGNQKLAADANGKTLIETRGIGGQVLSPLCLPETHPSGKPYKLLAGDLTKIPTITPEEREILFSVARSLNEYIEPKKAKGFREASQGNGTRPGEDFNGRPDVLGQVQSLLREYGWSKFGNGRAGELWSRPGVSDHSSATLYDSGYLYVFSSNALPFSAGEAYSPFAVYAELKHSGDFSAAAKDLAGLGFGQSNGHKPTTILGSNATPEKPAASRLFKLTTLDDLLAEPEEATPYAWDRTLPCGGVSILAAKPKVGKSTFARALAVAISRGESFFGRSTRKGKVIYLCLEEKRAEVKSHFQKMGATGGDILIHTGKTPVDALTPLEDLSKELSPVMVIIDPLSRFLRIADFNSYAEVTRQLEPLIDLARLSKCQTHLLCLHHNGKGGDMREGGDAVLGSTALFAVVDALLTMRRKDKMRTLESAQRYGDDLPETIVHLDPLTGMINASGDLKTFTMNERKRSVLDALGSEPLTDPAIRELVGGTNAGLTTKALRALFEEGTLQRTGLGKKGDPFLYAKASQEAGQSASAVEPSFTEDWRRKAWDSWGEKGVTA